MAKLEVKHLSKSFTEKPVLEGLNFYVNDQEIVSIVGPSGVGKSTLFHLIAGLLAPTAGDILLDGQSIVNQTGKVSYMLQKDLLFAYKTIEENVALPLILQGIKQKEALEKARRLLEEFGLASVAKAYPQALSGGMRQRVALLRTYLFSANFILLDEPFSALDPFTKSEIHDWYLKIQKQLQLTTLFITHDIDEAIKLSDRIYILKGHQSHQLIEVVIDPHLKLCDEYELSEAFLAYKRKIIHELKAK